MNSIITQSLARSYTYQEYRNQVATLLKEGKSTGNEQSEDLTHYSELNEVRMNRLDKTMVVPAENIKRLEEINSEMIWLVISEGWCGDAAQILPIINKMAEQSEKIDLKIVFRDENEELMNLFLTNRTKSIPKLIVLDKNTLEVLGDFGPRPTEAKQLILDYKATHGVVDETAKTELQKWYLHDKGLSTQREILNLVS
ncbi:thioredoxin family protein [Flavobacterium dankookense]|uniref:Thioredoxin-like protein n=1 Tax=Flavobacterium dankookense TaxID=706186 RepID=A0A4R6Q9F0_9FLAO|nr:thioredoxin family protein [Flavobacterium dankookense]TDP58785.1 thioredoxin-like protein [Flavobacterium dankookense]